MAWPKIEVHFESINQRPDRTEVSIALFRLADGGIVDGQQQYVRTLLGRRTYDRLDAGWDEQRIRDYFSDRLAEASVTYSINAALADRICTLKL